MLKISGIRIPASEGEKALRRALQNAVGDNNIGEIRILKKSVDARKKTDVKLIYTVAFSYEREDMLLCKNHDLSPWEEPRVYSFPFRNIPGEKPVAVVGMGPAGLFAAYCLCLAGVKTLLLEKGKPVEKRMEDVTAFWKAGKLDVASNVQFGEGGAGTFSDGKLTTGISDERIAFVNDTFVRFGAPEDIRYLAKPHIGTDRLRAVVRNMREELLRMGCEIRFETAVTDLIIEKETVSGITIEKNGEKRNISVAAVLLCPGNSARDTFAMLKDKGLSLEAKSFSVGVRIEHRQEAIDLAQYGEAATLGTLPHSDYKLAVHLPNGRSVYTFCVCPGGRVVAAASENGGVVTNGMSEYARNGENICGGLLVSVTPEDFANDPMQAVAFQRSLERSAYRCGGENYMAPAQKVGDFLRKQPSDCSGCVSPSYKPGVKWGNLWNCLPEFVCQSLAEALPQMGKKIKGFDNPDAVLTAVETRSSCPVRIVRGEDGQAVGMLGLFPAGEGAGYAGGIMSAAVDGIRAAEAVCRWLQSK